jgi:hypothetical protein
MFNQRYPGSVHAVHAWTQSFVVSRLLRRPSRVDVHLGGAVRLLSMFFRQPVASSCKNRPISLIVCRSCFLANVRAVGSWYQPMSQRFLVSSRQSPLSAAT